MKKEPVKILVPAIVVAICLSAVGILMIIVCKQSEVENHIVSDVLSAIGQALLGAGTVSLLLEISTIKQHLVNAVKVSEEMILDSLFGEEDKYFTGLDTEKIYKVRKILNRTATKKVLGGEIENKQGLELVFDKYDRNLMDHIAKGVICEEHKRVIKAYPNGKVRDPECKVCIAEEYEFDLLSESALSNISKRQFTFISEKQNESFMLERIMIDGNDVTENCTVSRKRIETDGPNVYAFMYKTKISIPFDKYVKKSAKKVKYTIVYSYINFEQSTYLTNNLKYLTKKFSESYSICTKENEYIIHGFTHFPFYNLENRKLVFDRIGVSTLKLEFDEWQFPGGGVSVVIRKANKFTENVC